MKFVKIIRNYAIYSFFLIIILIILWTVWGKNFFSGGASRIIADRSAVIKEMRSLNRLETASFTIEKVIDAGSTDSNIIGKLLFGDKILLIAHGDVIAGVDLSQIKEGDVSIHDSTLSIKLSAPTIFITSLDNSKTKVYDRQQGLLSDRGKDLESEARIEAEAGIKKAACEGGILTVAADNARKQLLILFTSLGFTSITIEIPEGRCT